jgi:hypothetical protein
MFRVWLDDERQMPDDFDIHIKTADELIDLIRQNQVKFISFDHDLGEPIDKNGYSVAKVIEQLAFEGIQPPEWQIHSANSVGRMNIRKAMESAEKLFERWLMSQP